MAVNQAPFGVQRCLSTCWKALGVLFPMGYDTLGVIEKINALWARKGGWSEFQLADFGG